MICFGDLMGSFDLFSRNIYIFSFSTSLSEYIYIYISQEFVASVRVAVVLLNFAS